MNKSHMYKSTETHSDSLLSLLIVYGLRVFIINKWFEVIIDKWFKRHYKADLSIKRCFTDGFTNKDV